MEVRERSVMRVRMWFPDDNPGGDWGGGSA